MDTVLVIFLIFLLLFFYFFIFFWSLTLNGTLKRLSPLPILKQNHSDDESVASGLVSFFLHLPGVSEFRSCVKVDVAVLGSRP